jgi:hypothetical protein
MEYITEGTLRGASAIEKINTQRGERSKRKFTITTNEEYSQVYEFELFGQKVELLNGLHSGDYVKVKFDIRGRDWTTKDGRKMVIMRLSVLDMAKVVLDGDKDEPVVEDDFSTDKVEETEDLPF